MRDRVKKKKPEKSKRGVAGYSNFGGGGSFAPMSAPSPRTRSTPRRKSTPKLPTLAQCEKALGEKAGAWAGRCYEIACKIVKAGLVKGAAVYGHWLGPVHRTSLFADRGPVPFVQHGWVLLADGRVFDPTRWAFEGVSPYLYVGEEPDNWAVTPCKNCELLEEEHGDDGPEDQCDGYEREVWPYDEGGNRWREAMTRSRPRPVPEGPRLTVSILGATATWIEGLLDENDASRLTRNQLFYLANFPYTVLKQAVGPAGVRMIYNALASCSCLAFIPVDNMNRARRECGFEPE